MKTLSLRSQNGLGLITSLAVLACGLMAPAQTTTSNEAIVTIQATTPVASGPGNPGVFSVFRQGNPNAALDVFYQIGGSASNGVDYATIADNVVLPAGVLSNSIVITPLSHSTTATTNSVVLELTPPLTANPGNVYEIGSASNAVVWIANIPHVLQVSIFSPTNGAVFYAPANIELLAKASDTGCAVTNVEFLAGTNNLGPGFPVVLDPPGVNGVTGLVYLFNWAGVPVGNYSLTAVATDNGGLSGTSVPVDLTVVPSPTNLPPIVQITNPTNGETYSAPANIFIAAPASAPVGVVTTVAFFENSLLLGIFTNPPPPPPGSLPPIVLPQFYWTNVSAGIYSLTAVAADSGGLSATSAPVNISVSVSNPPISIISPKEGTVFYTPTNIGMSAEVNYLASQYYAPTNVEFFAGTNDLGEGIPGVSSGFGGVVYLTWTNPSPGNYALMAVASYKNFANATSAPVEISVLPGPTTTNFPPVVRIISPPSGAVFHAPLDIPLFAYANEPGSSTVSNGSVVSVEFFNGTNVLGFGQPVTAAPPPLPPGPIQPPILILVASNYWGLVWTNPPPGTNLVLTAVATSSGGLVSTSAPVEVTVLPPVPPPTNRPPAVSIVATDPIAIEGTNCWRWPYLTNWPASPVAVPLYITNCGPKTATFTVFRSGDTNGDLTVAYAIGGTASNGVDYLTLPGSVTVPSGERRTLITLVPIDDGPPGITKTVILTLTPSTNAPPDYVVGYPPRAAALIVDLSGPTSTVGALPDQCFHLAMGGPEAAWFCVESSTDLINWTAICTNQVINGSVDFVDPEAAGTPAKYYRAVPSNPPSD